MGQKKMLNVTSSAGTSFFFTLRLLKIDIKTVSGESGFCKNDHKNKQKQQAISCKVIVSSCYCKVHRLSLGENAETVTSPAGASIFFFLHQGQSNNIKLVSKLSPGKALQVITVMKTSKHTAIRCKVMVSSQLLLNSQIKLPRMDQKK